MSERQSHIFQPTTKTHARVARTLLSAPLHAKCRKGHFLRYRSQNAAFLLLFLASFTFLHTHLYAQSPLREPTAWRIGLFGSYGLNYHYASFDALPGMLPNPFYDSAYTGSIGAGATVSGFFEKPLSHTFSLAARLSYSQLHTTFLGQTSVLQRPSGVDITGFSENRLQALVQSISAEPLLAWHPFFGLSVYLGARIGVGFGTSTLTRSIIDASGEVRFFEQDSLTSADGRSRTEFRDSVLQNLFLPQLGAIFGISYAIPLNPQETLFFAPEVWYAQNLTPMLTGWVDENGVGSQTQGNFWNASFVRFGASVRYSPEAPRIFMPPALVRTAQTKQLAINISPIAIDTNGVESPLLRLTVEEVTSRQMHPLLPYIFFDKAADAMPARYLRLQAQQTSGFTEEKLARLGTIEMYYHALNILGKRMKAHPQATLRLVGTLGNDEQEQGLELATRRAEGVMMYLRDVWRIPAERVSVEARIKPDKPSVFPKQGGETLASEENRRVEWYSDNWEIMKPLVFADTLREATPPTILFNLRADTKRPIKQWMLTLEQSKRLIRRSSGLGVPPEELVWSPAREQSSIPRTEDVVRCNFDFTEESSEGATATISFPIEQITIAERKRRGERVRTVDVYRILNADNASAALPAEQDRIFGLIAAQPFYSRGSVTATGYNDKALDTYGNPEENLRLALERARASSRALSNSIMAGQHIPSAIPKAQGGKSSIYAESTPEGRMYSRMVEIRVDTPSE
ncbi:MAG: hypothetical protein EAZ92_14465 [Candidatus Kapaibacterium sp.]|nr:MAG: hypothetical protein EAZ92_14465 [Candidatus Kapabacteria bacterium]